MLKKFFLFLINLFRRRKDDDIYTNLENVEEIRKMIKINVSDGKPHYSQRNNEIKPLGSCQVTAMTAALSYLDIPFGEGPYEQPEDNLRHLIEVQHGQNPEIHDVLSRFTNMWVGKKVTEFYTTYPMSDIIRDIKDGKPVVMSGTFPGYPLKLAKPLGHIVVLVGLIWEENDDKQTPDYVIFDDPYGDTMNNWRGSGNDIEIPWNLFIDWMKPCGIHSVKWAHRFI